MTAILNRAQAPPASALLDETVIVSPPDHRGESWARLLRRKISSRLSRHAPLELRKLVNARPMVSFTFDDAAVSAATTGARLLEERGGRGSFYVTTGLMGRNIGDYRIVDRAMVRDLHLRGHELALHSHEHRAVASVTEQEFRDDLETCRSALQAIHPGIRPTNFAYPFGLVDFSRKAQLSHMVTSSRSVAPGVNSVRFDPQFLRCVELTNQRLTPEALEARLDETVRLNGWLIFLTHDVADPPSAFGSTTGLFRRALDGVAARGIEIVTVDAALKRSVASASPFAPLAMLAARKG